MASNDIVTSWVSELFLAQQWVDWLDLHGPHGECKCNGFGPVPGLTLGPKEADHLPGTKLWDWVSHMDFFLDKAGSITYLAGVRDFLKGGTLTYLLYHLTEAIQDCAAGTASLLLMAFDIIEEMMNIEETRRTLNVMLALTVHARRYPCHKFFTVLKEDFRGHALAPNFERLPVLLRADSRTVPCAADTPKIFVYELSRKFHPRTLLGCSKGLAASEVWVHLDFLSSACRVAQPEEADLFFVPLYARCLWAEKYRIMEIGYNWDHPFSNATQWFLPLLRRMPYFRMRPEHHIFVFAEEHWPVPESMFGPGGLLGRSLVLSPEARPLRCAIDILKETGNACIHIPPRETGLLVIPSFVDSWRRSQLISHNQPMEKRFTLACFLGMGVDKAYSLSENFRDSLQAIAGWPRIVIGNYSDNYMEVMGNSVFCLVPKGVGTWSHRLYEVMLAGCIPVLLSDDVLLPFPFIPWQSFSVKWPMQMVTPVFAEYLESLADTSVVFSLKENVDRHACWFDYHSDDKECSPFLGITHQLRLWHEKGITEHGLAGFWGLQK